jgi:soluble lytic murein transglycosylase-like protein
MTPQEYNRRLLILILAAVLTILFSPKLHAEKPPDWSEPTAIRTILEAHDDSLPVGLSHIVAYMESRFKPLANNGQDRGLMQINRYYQNDIAWRHTDIDPASFNWKNPEHSAIAGCNYLAYLIDRFGGSVYLGLIAYNWGEGNLSRITSIDQIPEKVTNYADKALKLLDTWNETW